MSFLFIFPTFISAQLDGDLLNCANVFENQDPNYHLFLNPQTNKIEICIPGISAYSQFHSAQEWESFQSKTAGIFTCKDNSNYWGHCSSNKPIDISNFQEYLPLLQVYNIISGGYGYGRVMLTPSGESMYLYDPVWGLTINPSGEIIDGILTFSGNRFDVGRLITGYDHNNPVYLKDSSIDFGNKRMNIGEKWIYNSERAQYEVRGESITKNTETESQYVQQIRSVCDIKGVSTTDSLFLSRRQNNGNHLYVSFNPGWWEREVLSRFGATPTSLNQHIRVNSDLAFNINYKSCGVWDSLTITPNQEVNFALDIRDRNRKDNLCLNNRNSEARVDGIYDLNALMNNRYNKERLVPITDRVFNGARCISLFRPTITITTQDQRAEIKSYDELRYAENDNLLFNLFALGKSEEGEVFNSEGFLIDREGVRTENFEIISNPTIDLIRTA